MYFVFLVVLLLFYESMVGVLLWMHGMFWSVDLDWYEGVCRETVARSDNLAQASLSCLGEMSRDSLRLLSHEWSL